ncbi:MAG: TOBE domain-containing protein [Planctomycetota bacterium]
MAVKLECGRLVLTALVTPTSFKKLEVEPGAEFYATFKSSAVHSF